MYVCVAAEVCVYPMCETAQGSEKQAWCSLKLDLKAVVSLPTSAGDQTRECSVRAERAAEPSPWPVHPNFCMVFFHQEFS